MSCTYSLTVEPLGRTVEIREGQTILDACLREGIWLPHACGHGLCSSCKVDVTDGDVDHGPVSPFALMDFEREEGKALACCATPQSDLTIEADLDVDPDARCYPVRDFTATVVEIVDLTPDIKGVWLELNHDITFQAGQYINLSLPGMNEPRAYSLANPPSDTRRIELHIRLVPGGQGSTYVHQQLKVGDSLTVSGPYGQFFVRASRSAPMLFLAGGSGLSSPKSMILDLLAQGCTQPMTLIHGVRTAKDVFFADLFQGLAAQYPHFTYVPALSGEVDAGWTGATGFVHDVAEQQFQGRFSGMQAYLCGPPAMIDAAIQTLMKGRLFEQDIFTERFFSAADRAGDGKKSSPLFRRL